MAKAGMMSVLMFGWEFPPHISGGLGTACYGLTQALLKAQVEVLFVVPRVFGSESEREDFLINASAVSHTPRPIPTALLNEEPTASTEEKFERDDGQHMTLIEVPAHLAPYNSPATEKLIANRAMALCAWQYALHAEGRIPEKVADDTAGKEENSETDEVFAFTGSYGAGLLKEVSRYADVAGVIADKYSFDVIHAHDWMTFPAGMEAKRRTKKPLIIHVHSTEFDRAGDHINHDVFEVEKSGFHAADKIVAVSNWTKQIVVSRYGIPEEKIVVVHNGILPRVQAEQFPFPDIGSHFVTFLGRVTHQKGPWYFVEAAQKVLQEFPEAHFIVAGAGDLLPQTIEQVAQQNMSTSFHFTGFLSSEQVDQIWSLTDVYVMPSVSEPFGIAPLEAIQGGVPVILSRQSGVSEVMPHAITVDFWDVKALAAAICSVLRYDSLSRTLRQNSKKHIEHLTWDKAARDVKAVYDEVTRNK